MFQENSIETCILSRVKQITSPGWMHETSAQAWCTGKTQWRGIRWRGRWEGGLGWGIHVNPWLIHFNVWQKPLQCCKVISLQLIKINGKKKKRSLQVIHTALELGILLIFPLRLSFGLITLSSNSWCQLVKVLISIFVSVWRIFKSIIHTFMEFFLSVRGWVGIINADNCMLLLFSH